MRLMMCFQFSSVAVCVCRGKQLTCHLVLMEPTQHLTILFVGSLHSQTGTGPFVLLNIIEMCNFATLSRKQMGWQCYNWIPLCPGQTFKKLVYTMP